MDIDILQRQWTDALGKQGDAANAYANQVALGQTVGQQQIKQGVADAQRKMAAQARSTGSPGAQRAAVFGAGNMASQAIGQGAQMSAEEQARAAQMQMQAAQSQAQGYASAADWQQQRDNAALNMFGNIFGGAAGAAGGAAMMMSDETRKTAIRHIEAGDADSALDALRGGGPEYRVPRAEVERIAALNRADGGARDIDPLESERIRGPVDRENAMREQDAMDRFIDARIRASGRDPYAMSDADHEREAVRIMATPEGQRWRPGAADDKVAALGRDLGALDADTSRRMRYADIPVRDARAEALGRDLSELDADTSRRFRYAAPLGGSAPAAHAPLGAPVPQSRPEPEAAPPPAQHQAARAPVVVLPTSGDLAYANKRARYYQDAAAAGDWTGQGATPLYQERR